MNGIGWDRVLSGPLFCCDLILTCVKLRLPRELLFRVSLMSRWTCAKNVGTLPLKQLDSPKYSLIPSNVINYSQKCSAVIHTHTPLPNNKEMSLSPGITDLQLMLYIPCQDSYYFIVAQVYGLGTAIRPHCLALSLLVL